MPKVKAKNDDIARLIYHPATGAKFNSQGVAEWPMDQFTYRRIRDGDVTVESADVSSVAPFSSRRPRERE